MIRVLRDTVLITAALAAAALPAFWLYLQVGP